MLLSGGAVKLCLSKLALLVIVVALGVGGILYRITVKRWFFSFFCIQGTLRKPASFHAPQTANSVSGPTGLVVVNLVAVG